MSASSNTRIAQRYVKALFDVAKSAQALDAVEADMATLSQALKTNRDFRHFLGNPLLSRENRAQTMVAVLEKMQAHKVTSQFIATLARQRRLVILGDITQLFAQAVADARGEMSAELVAAGKLSPEDAMRVAERLGKVYGKKINLSVREDASLLGGAVVKIGSKQMDGSLAGKLQRLRQGLKVA